MWPDPRLCAPKSRAVAGFEGGIIEAVFEQLRDFVRDLVEAGAVGGEDLCFVACALAGVGDVLAGCCADEVLAGSSVIFSLLDDVSGRLVGYFVLLKAKGVRKSVEMGHCTSERETW